MAENSGDVSQEERKARLQHALQQKHDKIQTFVNTNPNLGVAQSHGDTHPVTGGSPFETKSSSTHVEARGRLGAHLKRE